MARLARSALPAQGIYHVTARGVARGPIFLDDEDRTGFVGLLQRVTERLLWKCHAYCLMDNHYHTIVETQLQSLSRGFHRINGIHAQQFNERHARVGHLFQERFHAQVVRDDEHLANTCEYIWNNPVRVGRCATAADWPWNGAF